jgi:hypothetical protein
MIPVVPASRYGIALNMLIVAQSFGVWWRSSKLLENFRPTSFRGSAPRGDSRFDAFCQ